jgi:hypothetical protein
VKASAVKSLLIEEFPRVEVTVRNGKAFIHIRTGLSIPTLLTEKKQLIEKVEAIAIGLGGAEKAHVALDHPI